MKILIVENDTSISAQLVEILTANDYVSALATDSATALYLAKMGKYDLMLLDWQIPHLDGINFCRELRSQGYNNPILLLTTKNPNPDIVAGLDAGADDYLLKPYEPEVLLVRMQALLRRSTANKSCTLKWGDLCLDANSGKVTYQDQLIPLTATEYNVLELFLQNRDRIFSRSAILDRLWSFDDAPTENAVTTHIKDLRKKLKAGGLSEEIVETVYGMGYRLKPAPEPATSVTETNQNNQKKPISKNMTAVNRVLEQYRYSFREQVNVLEQAKTAILTGNLNEELHQIAKTEAHKLAGAMGTFGYPEGSKIAREAEHLLENYPFNPDKISQLCQLVTALQHELTKSPINLATQLIPLVKIHRVLVIDDDTTLTNKLQSEANSWGIRIKIAPDLPTARSRLNITNPDAIILDLSFSQTEEDGLTLLRELAEKSPDIPVIVFTGRNTLADRLAVSRLGARQFLHKPATTKEIFTAIARVLPQPKTSEAKVLIVDDDPVMLAALSTLLTPWGLEVTTLSKPQTFWEILIATSPDLVVLDLEMPLVNGLELCQVVRQDAHWGDLAILVVTAHTDAESLQQAFAAGADDFITKPVLGPELVTRVLSRIKRLQFRQKKQAY